MPESINDGNEMEVINKALTRIEELAKDLEKKGSAVRLPPARTELPPGPRQRITDVDMAVESEKMAKNSVLQQSAIGMQAQPHQNPQASQKLLGQD
jgi:flagellin-like hook-associated protein FlgL